MHTNVFHKAGTAPSWLRYALIFLIVEKTIQHIFVTMAFIYDIGDIRDEVILDYRLFMVSGAFVAVLFALSLWGFLKHKPWSIHLITGLAIFDIIGEFIAQGAIILPVVTVSVVVAALLLILIRRYYSQQATATTT